METDFRSLLADDPAIVGYVSTRIYPATYAQGSASPAIRYTKVSGSTGLHMAGSDGLSDATMQVDVRVAVADGIDAADVAMTIRDAIVARLHGYRGIRGDTDFQLIELTSDRGVSFDDTGAAKYYAASLDFNVFSRTAA